MAGEPGAELIEKRGGRVEVAEGGSTVIGSTEKKLTKYYAPMFSSAEIYLYKRA